MKIRSVQIKKKKPATPAAAAADKISRFLASFLPYLKEFAQ